MIKNLSVSEIRAVAEAAITAQHIADVAKTALDADPSSESLKKAFEQAASTATEAKAKADALSQNDESTLTPEQIAKKKRKIAIIQKELRNAGAIKDDDDEDDNEDDEDEDPDRPVTFGDLQRMQTREASKTAGQMADAIQDSVAKDAVKSALKRVVPSGNPEQDFRDAVSIANREKNNKILEEIGRRPVVIQHRSGAGAPARSEEGNFEPSAEEATYMRAPFNLTKEQILKARGQ